MDDGELDLNHLGRLNEIWVNASRYNRQTKELDKNPKVRAEWKQLVNRLNLADEYPSYIYKQIEERTGRPEDIGALTTEQAQVFFYFNCLHDFISSVRPDFIGNFTAEQQLSLLDNFEEYQSGFSSWFNRIYEEVGLAPPQHGSMLEHVIDILGHFGFTEVQIKSLEYVYDPNAEEKSNELTRVCHESSEGEHLMKFSSEGGHQIITLNQEHLFYKKNKR